MLRHISVLVPSAKRSLEAQRHRCADAGTPVQQRGQSLPRNAEALGDLTDRYSLGEILAEDLTGVRRVVHIAHGGCLSVVAVQIIDEFDDAGATRVRGSVAVRPRCTDFFALLELSTRLSWSWHPGVRNRLVRTGRFDRPRQNPLRFFGLLARWPPPTCDRLRLERGEESIGGSGVFDR